MTRHPEKLVAITGIGQTRPARPAKVSPLALTMDACLEAIADAGLKPADIRAVSSYPGMIGDSLGYSPVPVYEIRQALGLDLIWYSANSLDSASHMSAMFNGILAIAAGLVDHVLVYRTLAEASSRIAARKIDAPPSRLPRVSAMGEHPAAFGLSAAGGLALYAQRRFHEHGLTSRQLGWLAVNARTNAAGNPNAIYREPITIEDYLNSRVISSPLRLYDCDVPIDGSTALVLSHIDRARHLKNPAIRIEAVGSASSLDSSTRPESMTSWGAETAADMMWSRTDLKPADVDVAELYDGFSIHTIGWLEALGFCGVGEAGAFIEGGRRIALDGELPLNTGGGQLSGGRFHGYGHTYEACMQLWGRGGERQVAGAPQVAVSANGTNHNGCMVLVRES